MVTRKALVGGSLLGAALLWAPTALAQSVVVSSATRETASGAPDLNARPVEYDPSASFNYADCVGDKKIEFALTVDDPNMASDHLVVLAGPGGGHEAGACIPAAGAKTIPTGCWPVAASVPASAAMSVTVRARDVTTFLDSTALPTTYAAQTNATKACQSQTCPGPVTLNLTFLIEGADDTVPAAEQPGVWGPLLAGTLGPQAPADFKAGVGDGFVTMTWTPPTEPAVYGYYVYCESYGRIDAALPDAPLSSGPDVCSDSQPGCVNYSDAGMPSGACPTKVFSDLYTVPSCTSSTTTTDSSSGIDTGLKVDTGLGTSTATDAFVATGPIDTNSGISSIPAKYQCAYPSDKADGATTLGGATSSATVTASNFDFYVFAVAAVDSIGNVGPVSNLACGTPGPIKDFWYNYSTLDGGLAGGGYCALEGVGMPAGSACMTVGVGIAAVSLIRRRRRRR